MANALARIALLCFCAVSPLGAAAQEVQIGRGLVCDTQEQAATFAEGQTEATLAAINAESPNACGVIAVAYVRGAEAARIRTDKGTFAVTAIIVVGIVTPFGVQAVPPVAQFTLFAVNEQGA